MSRDEVRAFDQWAIESAGIPGGVLMENAGRSCAELIKEKLAHVSNPNVCLFCGTGNNGGDGFVIARHLLNANFTVKTIICGDKNKFKGDAKINLDVLEKLSAKVELLDVNSPAIITNVKSLAGNADVIVDALFGTGLAGEVAAPYKRLIDALNALNRPILAVDIPSGLDCDTGRILGAAIKANWTVTFVAIKKGFLTPDAQTSTGEIYVASIGLEPAL